MLKKMMTMFAVMFSTVMIVNAQEVTEELEKAGNDPQVATETQKDAEIQEINAQDKAKVAEDAAQLEGDTAEQIKDDVSKDVAEDESLGSEEIIEEETPEPAVAEEKDSGSSWFGWLWPFGGDDDDAVAEESTNEPVAENAANGEIATEEVVVEETPAVEEVTGEEPVVDVAETEADSGSKINIKNKLLYYFPNLFLNLLDSFSAKIGVGAKSGLELALTRYAKFGGNYGDEYFVEKGIYRTYGGGYNNGFSADFAPFSSEKRYIDNVFGSISPRIIKKKKLTLQRPTDPFYKEKYRNFWAVGIEGGWLINIGLDLNPIEFADFFTGIFFYDLCDDDLGRTETEDAANLENAESGEVIEEGEAVEKEAPEAVIEESEAIEETADGATEEVSEAVEETPAGDVEEAEVSEETPAGDVEEAEASEESSDADSSDSDDDFGDF